MQEYILIGETGGGCCGSDKTWGYNMKQAPHDADGFERVDLDMKYQICKTDIYGEGYYHSKTVSFKRKINI